MMANFLDPTRMKLLAPGFSLTQHEQLQNGLAFGRSLPFLHSRFSVFLSS